MPCCVVLDESQDDPLYASPNYVLCCLVHHLVPWEDLFSKKKNHNQYKAQYFHCLGNKWRMERGCSRIDYLLCYYKVLDVKTIFPVNDDDDGEHLRLMA